MVYYPLSTLMLAGIRDILVITTPQDQEGFRATARKTDPTSAEPALRLTKPGKPEGIAQAFIIGQASSSATDRVALALGDNVFYGHGLPESLRRACGPHERRRTVFGYRVRDPERYGVVEFDDSRGQGGQPGGETQPSRALPMP